MKNFDMKKINQAGSLMIEAIAMLGLISLVTPVVYKKSAERMTELQDINAASHLRMLSSALDAYISDNYDKLKDSVGEYTLTADKLANYLPNGAVEEGKVYGPLGEDYKFSYVVKKTDNDKKPVITGYVGANVTDDKITAQRTSRIATMIGGNGAIVDNGEVLGVQGTWQADATDIKFDGINDNSVVVASQNAVGATAQIDTSKFLYRVEDDVENNTMQTNLYMHDGHNSHSIEGVSQLLIGYQMGRASNSGGSLDVDKKLDEVSAGGYALYVSSNTNDEGVSNTWLGGSLQAAKGRLEVTESKFEYNPYYTKTGNGERYAESGTGAGLVVDGGGLSFSTGANSHDEFKLTGEDLTYSDNLIVAKNGAGTTEQAVRFFASSTKDGENTTDTSAATFTKDEARFFGETDGPKVSIKKDGTTIRNQLVAMNPKNIAVTGKKTTYTADAGFKDYYTRIGESAPAESNYNVLYSDAKNANILSGRTIATQLETGYLKSDNFDTKSLRAGRSDLKNSDETWMLDVEDGVARLGKDNPADTSARPLASALYVVDYDSSVKDISNTERNMGIYMISRNSGNLNRNAMVAINPDGVNTTVKGGDIVMNVSPSDSTMEVDGTITLSRDKVEANNGINVTPKDDKGSFLQFNASNNIQLQGDQYIHIQTVHHKFGDNANGGKVVLQNDVLAVSGSDDVSKGDDNFDVKNRENSTIRAGVYIRRGSIDVQQFDDLDDISSSTGKNAADAGTGYVKADRFVVENTSSDRDPKSVYVYKDDKGNTYNTYPVDNPYDHYMVDPAYTSVMHDIKLTSRGGARLSDILPDFINKGIYVTDNSYGEGTTPKEDGISSMNDSVKEDKTSIFASAFLGVVPAPQCPPGYAKVITLTPAGWRMAQIGTLVEDSSANAGNRLYLNESTPMYAAGNAINKSRYDMTSKGLIKGDIKEIPAGGGSITIPRIFQQNTWLKSAIKLNLGGKVGENNNKGNEYSTGGKFVGWNTYMGFIYPSVLWSHLFNPEETPGMGGSEAPQLGQGDNKIYWNLFPVDKWSIEGYATVYCYFDRNGLTNNGKNYFNSDLVDTTYNQYSTLRTVGQGASKENSKYTDRLTNPKLKYEQEW